MRRKRKEIKEMSFQLRISEAELSGWQAAAERDGRTVSGWLRWLAAKEIVSSVVSVDTRLKNG